MGKPYIMDFEANHFDGNRKAFEREGLNFKGNRVSNLSVWKPVLMCFVFKACIHMIAKKILASF